MGLNSVETMLQMPLPSKPSSEASVSMPMKKKMNKVISELSGKAIADVLAEGKEKLASVPSGGGAPQLLVLLPPVVLKKLQLLKPRRNHHPRMKTKIWDSVFSTKK